MDPIDKFGNHIYPSIYTKMLGYSRILTKNGYSESRTKHNLFFKNSEASKVIFFADMRGTTFIPIWKDPSPMLYARFPDNMPEWNQKRLFEEEYYTLRICRLSFYEQSEPDGLMFSEGGDGYCVVCGKDFQNGGLFCSNQCQDAYTDLGKTRCRVCGKELCWNKVVNHHLSYTEDKIITVCQSCHLKIHRGSNLPKLKPPDAYLRLTRQRVKWNQQRIAKLAQRIETVHPKTFNSRAYVSPKNQLGAK